MEEPKNQSDHDLLVRIDERTMSLHTAFANLEKNAVTQDEFRPVRLIAYGLVGLILVAVIGAVMTLVLR